MTTRKRLYIILLMAGFSAFMLSFHGPRETDWSREPIDSTNKTAYGQVVVQKEPEETALLIEYGRGMPQSVLLPKLEFCNSAAKDSIENTILSFLHNKKYAPQCSLWSTFVWDKNDGSCRLYVELSTTPIQSLGAKRLGSRLLGYIKMDDDTIIVTGVPDFDGYSICQDDSICISTQYAMVFGSLVLTNYDIIFHRIVITDSELAKQLEEVHQRTHKQVEPGRSPDKMSDLYFAKIGWENKRPTGAKPHYVVSERRCMYFEQAYIYSEYTDDYLTGYTEIGGHPMLVYGIQPNGLFEYKETGQDRKSIPIYFKNANRVQAKVVKSINYIIGGDDDYGWIFKLSADSTTLLTQGYCEY